MSGFRHVVLIEWAEGTTTSQQEEAAARLAELPGLIPEIRSYSVGGDAGIDEGNADFVIVGEFADQAAYETYRDHPAHRAVVGEYIRPFLARRAAIQYEL
ncbi:Dabb family protein [Actinomadura macrotermitis]|uniref:Stress-response A/B barrel domain-containing protein n=1 Tax=Actinomadura macrotermitis TaxID=2585200 RepID=A0A7K0BNX7_9ACTN|nr:Dabb family protein [Actinomadura macrotermitis]MQY02899.1 hypothetical protein [Actinomadura macrotermitis]